MYDEHPWLPYYIEFSTPTINYTSFIKWDNENLMSFDLFSNNKLITNGSGLYRYDYLKHLSIDLTDIHPEHIGNISINYNGNLTINASKLLGGELFIGINRLSNWQRANINIQAKRTFFFFKQSLLFNLFYDINQSSFNLTFIRNENSKIQWAFIKQSSHIHHLFIINSSLLEIDHQAQVFYLLMRQ